MQGARMVAPPLAVILADGQNYGKYLQVSSRPMEFRPTGS